MRAPLRVLIVEGRFYSELSDALLKGATDALEAFGAQVELVTVPGALEIPARHRHVRGSGATSTAMSPWAA